MLRKVLDGLSRLFRRGPDRPIVSLVMLLETPRVLEEGAVVSALQSAYGEDFDRELLISPAPGVFQFWIHEFFLSIAASPEPYFERRQAQDIPEQRLRDAALRHRACLLIDCFEAAGGKERSEAIPAIGKLMAEFWEPASLLVFSTVTLRMNLCDEPLRQRFEAGEADDAMHELTFDPVIGIRPDDPRLQKATEEARRAWPDFLAEWSAPVKAEGYLVKAPFTGPTRQGSRETEHMWIEVKSIDGDAVTGVLGNEPMDLTHLRVGETVTVSTSDIEDWAVFREGQEPKGLFSQAVMDEIARGS